MVTEGAEQESIRAPRHDAGGNGSGASVGCDRKDFRKKLLGAGTEDALGPVCPARVTLLIGTLATIVLRWSPGRTSRTVTGFGALARRSCTVDRSRSYVTLLTGPG